MTLKEIKDKLEIGLKPDAPYRPTNLPESEQDDQAGHDVGVDGKNVPAPSDTGNAHGETRRRGNPDR